MNRPIIKFIADFGPLLIFFTIYFTGDNDLESAIPPFIIATLISLAVIYLLEKRIPMVPLISGVLITLFGGLTLYFNNKIFFYMKPTIINLLFAGFLFFGKYITEKPLLKIFFQNCLISSYFYFFLNGAKAREKDDHPIISCRNPNHFIISPSICNRLIVGLFEINQGSGHPFLATFYRSSDDYLAYGEVTA
mgnify:CR=1 FL=1